MEPIVVEEALTEEPEEDTTLLADRNRPLFTARVDPRTKAEIGGPLRLAVDPSRLYFFSHDSGTSLLGRPVASATA